VKNIADLRAECAALGIKVEAVGRTSKEPYIAALREHHWQRDDLDEPLPSQTMPMLLGFWENLDEGEAEALERDHHAWIVQPKFDGARVLLHIERDRVRITSLTVSEVTYRLAEFQDNLPHLSRGLEGLAGAIFDGELVCPRFALDTGNTVTASSLQATTAILSTSPEKARQIQQDQDAQLRLHVFDVLRFRGEDATKLPLIERQSVLENALHQSANSFIEAVPSYAVHKAAIHYHIIAAGGEGTVWKRADAPYEPGRRVDHWIKRKRGIEVEAFVIGFKLGTNGHTGMVGAIEFGVWNSDETKTPIVWISNLTNAERIAITATTFDGKPTMGPRHIGRRAVISGHELSAKAKRIRHARVLRWVDQVA